MITIDLQGLDELIKEFDRLGKDVSKHEISAIKAAAEILQQEISRRAPRSEVARGPVGKQTWRTGEHLADNILISRIRRDNGTPYVLVGPSISDKSPYFYGKFHEWGTLKMSATPFIQPAIEVKESEMIEALKEELKKGLRI